MSLKTEHDVLTETARVIRQRRLALNWTQEDISARSGVPLGTLRRLEQSGRAPFLTVAKVLTTLGMTDRFLDSLGRPADSAPSIDAFLAQNSTRTERQRARRRRVTP
ncbi:MAG TPA: helix-turn-helix transcriptional regulator [Opitutaceae bacterium]